MPRQASSPAPLESLPAASAVHRRLGEVIREERLLRRLLRLVLDRERLLDPPAGASTDPSTRDQGVSPCPR